MNALTQLRAYLANWLAELRSRRDFVAVLDVECVQDIAAEISTSLSGLVGLAYKAEVNDLEAAKLLERATADGLDKSDLPAVRRALAMIRRSAEADHQISEEVARV